MVVDVFTSGPTTTAISQIIDTIGEFLYYASDVLVKKESFKELAAYHGKNCAHLKELRKEKVSDSETFNRAIEVMNGEIKNAKATGSRMQQEEQGIIEEIEKLCDNMQEAGFKAAVAEEEILEKIESGIRENNVNRSYANNLLILIAEAVGITNERSAVKMELEEFKKEIENARIKKELAEAMQMDQIIALLERADAASSPRERELKYFAKRQSLGNQILEPLQSFYCPITKEVMVDPVETSSGQTFERSAIEKWFAEGNTLCPLTMISLDTSILRPNKTLKQSIEEWKDRNTMITIATVKEKIQSGERW
ncbi:Zinc finger, RING/FYVE/PHD-type [Sesbania bispinosa]|nr:Zinc finger, RING/FYVE/PHD-type [Sesbania bispinosa]